MPSASVPPPAADVLTADTSRDPDTALRIFSWIVVVFALLQIVTFSFGRDQSIYAVVGSGLLDGQMPYRDLWDFKPPGIFLVYAASFGVFGHSMIAPRLVEALCAFAVVLGCRRLGGTLFESRTAGLLGGALATLLHAELEFWHTGQPETFAGALTIAALVVTTHSWNRKREPLAWLAVGALAGLAFLLKPPLGGLALPCALYLAFLRRRDGRSLASQLAPLGVMTLGSILPIALTLGWFAARGALPDLRWTLSEFAPGYTRLSWVGQNPISLYAYGVFEAFFKLSALVGAGVVLLLFFERRTRASRPGIALIVSVVLVQLAGVALQGKFFQYHYAASLPLLACLAGVGFYRLWRRFCLDSTLAAFAFALLLVALAVLRLPVRDVPHGFWARSATRLHYLLGAGRVITREELDRDLYYVADYNLDADRKLAGELRRTLPQHATVYVWGFEPLVYWQGEFTPASRFIYNVPQRALWQADVARRLLLEDLGRHPPAAVVVQHADVFPFVTGNTLGSGDSLALFPELESWLHDRYRFSHRLEDFEIWLAR